MTKRSIELQTLLDAACGDGRLDAACLAISSHGQTRAFAAGLANPREGVAATPDTLFHIGSVTKAITAELIWRLVEAGRLSPGTTIAEAAPELARLETLADPRLTVAHLLSHTGGLDGDVIFEAGRGKDVLRRFMLQIPTIGSLFAPGANFSYANVAYNILARIVELTGGRSFEDALRDLLHGTYGLSHLAILPEEKVRQLTALHFTHESGKWLPSRFGPHSNIGSGTMLAMGMPDLVRWATALLDTGEIVRSMSTPAIQMPFSHRYEGWGFGVSLLDDCGNTLFGHDGGTAGTATFLRIAPKQNAAWAFAATGRASLAVYREIEPLLREEVGLGPAATHTPQGALPADLGLYEGVYARHGMTFTVQRRDDNALVLTTAGRFAFEMLNGLVLRPLDGQVFETRIPTLDALVRLSFHDFAADGRPQLFFALERMAKRTQELP